MADSIRISGANIQGVVAIGSSAAASNTGRQSVANSPAASPLEELMMTLAGNGVSAADLAGLKDAIAKDANTQEVASKKLGPAVRAWMSAMFSKAASASWQIELGMAGSLLASALERYYRYP